MDKMKCEVCGDDGDCRGTIPKCTGCWEVERRLGRYLRTEKGLAFVKHALNKRLSAKLPAPATPTLYPEHAKLKACNTERQAVGDFILWLGEHGYYICEKREPTDSKADRRLASRLGDVTNDFEEDEASDFSYALQTLADAACVYWPTMKRLPNALLAEHFKIDENKIEDEKRQMLDAMRAVNDKK